MTMSFSTEFIQQVVLLILTALISSVVIPLIFRLVDQRREDRQKERDHQKALEQKQFEAILARQGKIIDAQSQLLDDLAQALWEFQLRAISVSYYSLQNQQNYDNAVQKYQADTANILIKIRTEISKSLRLVPLETYQSLCDLYYKQLLPLDQRLEALINSHAAGTNAREQWLEFNKFAVYELATIVDNKLNNLAAALRLNTNTVQGS